MKITATAIDEIKPYAENPRQNEKAVAAVEKSIAEFGFQQPIVCDKRMVIIVGHTRYQAARRLGLASVPVVIADKLTEDQAKAYRIADNKTGEKAGWDYEKLIAELNAIQEGGGGYIGFDHDKLKALSRMGELEDGFDDDGEGENVSSNDNFRVLLKFGGIQFRVDNAEFERWIEEVRHRVGFGHDKIKGEIRRRLRL